MRWTKRNILIGLAVAILVVLNGVRWWPSNKETASGGTHVMGDFAIDEFEVFGIQDGSLPPFSRDIFRPQSIVPAKPRTKLPPSAAQSVPTKSPEDMAKESAQAEFLQIRCAGVSIRNDRIQAYIINAGDPLLISIGDKVGSRFVAENIVPDGVYLRDPDTEVGGLVSISGK